MIRLSLKQCWNCGKLDLVPTSRTFWKILKSFIERKTCNIAQYYYSPNCNNKFLRQFLFVEMYFWSWVEYNITRKFR